MPIGIDPKVDYAFKRLFGLERNHDLLKSLINAVLGRPRQEEIVEVEILNPFNPKELEEDKLSIVDVKARDNIGRLFDIEMQLAQEACFDRRVLYYWAKMYGAQLAEGDDYHATRPTISIAICNFVLYPRDPQLHHRFELHDRQTGTMFTSDIELHTIELPKVSGETIPPQDDLVAWSFFLRHAESFDPSSPPFPLRGGVWDQAWKELAMISLKNEERELYEARLRLTRDERAKLDFAREQGLERGIEQGLERGREQGVLIGRITLLESLLGDAVTSRDQLQSTTIDELRNREHALMERLAKSAPREKSS